MLLCLTCLFSASVNVAKAARDSSDAAFFGGVFGRNQDAGFLSSAARRPKADFPFFTVVFNIAALALHFGALYCLPFAESQRKFCPSGSLYVLSSVVAVTKIVRDREERTFLGEGTLRAHLGRASLYES
jgi:hypothetical protein